MSAEKNSRLSSFNRTKPPNVLVRIFGGLKVRQKLALLHNVFFFVLAVSVYLSVIPLFSQHIEAARERELGMVAQIFSAELPMNHEEQVASRPDREAIGERVQATVQRIGKPSA